MPGARAPDPEYVAARRVLLNVLDALGVHRKAVVLVGAQAIYLRVGEGALAVSPYTTDGDLAIDPRVLDDEPSLVSTLEAAGFELIVRPGTWSMTNVQIDLMVPAILGGTGRRGARLGAHGSKVARKATGLEAAMVDQSCIPIAALDATDRRMLTVNVAGVAALIVAKLHKIAERNDTPERLEDKDGLDVLRLLQFEESSSLASTLAMLAEHSLAGDVTQQARVFLDALFGSRNGIGARMAIRASAGLEDPQTIALSCESLAQELLAAWK